MINKKIDNKILLNYLLFLVPTCIQYPLKLLKEIELYSDVAYMLMG